MFREPLFIIAPKWKMLSTKRRAVNKLCYIYPKYCYSATKGVELLIQNSIDEMEKTQC